MKPEEETQYSAAEAAGFCFVLFGSQRRDFRGRGGIVEKFTVSCVWGQGRLSS